jgi:hypothetical protein
MTVVAEALELPGELGVLLVHVVAEDMDPVPAVDTRELDARNDLDAELFAR